MEDNKTLHAVKVGNNTKEYTITEKRMKICENDKDEKIRQKKHDKRQGQEEE